MQLHSVSCGSAPGARGGRTDTGVDPRGAVIEAMKTSQDCKPAGIITSASAPLGVLMERVIPPHRPSGTVTLMDSIGCIFPGRRPQDSPCASLTCKTCTNQGVFASSVFGIKSTISLFLFLASSQQCIPPGATATSGIVALPPSLVWSQGSPLQDSGIHTHIYANASQWQIRQRQVSGRCKSVADPAAPLFLASSRREKEERERS